FILSAEIMAITLAAVPDMGLPMQALVLVLVGIGITIVVYGAVALIVKADDLGVVLARNDGSTIPAAMSRLFGRSLVLGMPGFLTLLGAIGTAAMIWVGGSIIVHGFESYHVGFIERVMRSAGEVATFLSPSIAAPVRWAIETTVS